MSLEASHIVEHLKQFPKIFNNCIAEQFVPPTDALINDFGDDSDGRGIEYVRSVEVFPNARTQGIKDLLGNFINRDDQIILDGLAGDGYVSKIAKSLGFNGNIVSNDLSLYMVNQAIKNGFPAIWQSIDSMPSLRDGSFDGVLLAYGVHHLPLHSRFNAYQESARITKPGGKLVLHDFVNGSNMARFFLDVVDKYSKTGHQCDHFDARETVDQFKKAGFSNAEFDVLEEHFEFVAETKEEALSHCAQYIYNMYGLEKLGDINQKSVQNRLLDYVETYLGISLEGNEEGVCCKVKREALLVVGNK